METNNTIQNTQVNFDGGIGSNDIINGAASEYIMPTEKLDKYEYADRRGMNQEFYQDPTYHTAKNRNGYFRNGYQQRSRNSNGTPVYFSTRSKRYELIGIITRLCDLAGFELAERIVLRDKETGEVLR